MIRFFIGDDIGQLKSVNCSKAKGNEWKVETSVLNDGGREGKTKAVQRVAVMKENIALARADGTVTLFCTEESADSAQMVQQWQETRFRKEHHYVGLDIIDGDVVSCTSAGHLRWQRSSPDLEDGSIKISNTTSIPDRLCELVVSDDRRHFAYGGDEVEISIWDITRAFDPSRCRLPPSNSGTKRRSDLIDGEMWRAKNVSNDFLNLRQPVHNTTLTFLAPMHRNGASSHHVLSGTRIGSVRRYDTRAARKPVADWKDVGRVGGVLKVQRGISENQALVADHGGNLLALDLRTGGVLHAYKGISGAICSLAPTSSFSPPLFASISLDRFFRLHRAPKTSDGPINDTCELLGKHWIKSAAGCVAWDGILQKELLESQAEVGEEDDVWAGMQPVGEGHGGVNETDEDRRGRKHKRRKLEASSEVTAYAN